MTSKSDVKKLVETETERLGFTMQLANGRWLITNPENGRTGEIPLQAMGRGLDNYKTKIRSLLHDHPTKPSPMVAATDLATEKANPMPRDTWWTVETLLEGARANGIKPYASGGILHTPGPIEAQSYADMLHAREAEVIAHLTRTTATTKGEPAVPTIGESAHVIRKPRDVAADAEALWGLLREEARKQGDKPLTNGNVPGVQWCGALSDIIKTACPDWDTLHEKDVRQYLNRTEHTRCHRPRVTPPVWWIALKWNNGDLTVTRTAPKPEPQPSAATAPASAAAPPAAAGPALQALISFEKAIQKAEQRTATAERERDEARRERDKFRQDREDARAEVDELRVELDQVRGELNAINAVFARINGSAS
ncbi:hypothetical protein ACFV0L_18705 [Streptosporangium canum]|uniref:hypothetical protein n=1 Tax=Streptosporangium canum TaxID=324952 RepID=UPI0036AFB588